MKRLFRNAGFYVLLALILLFVAAQLLSGGTQAKKLTLTDFEQRAARSEVVSAELVEPDDKVKGTPRTAPSTRPSTRPSTPTS